MNDELRQQAEKTVKGKKVFYILAVVFLFTSLILAVLTFALPGIGLWLIIPIPAFLLVLGIVYIVAFGFPGANTNSANWEEEEIEKEMRRLYRQKRANLPPLEEMSKTEKLELKELERQIRGESDEDFV